MNAVQMRSTARVLSVAVLIGATACASRGRPNTGLNDDRLAQRYNADINLVVEAAQLALEQTDLEVQEVRQQRAGMYQIIAASEPFGVETVRILCAAESDGRVEVRILNQRIWSRAYRRGMAERIFSRIGDELARMGVGE